MPSQHLQAIKMDGRIPMHVAVIMDGNGRWARARGLPRYRGHNAGMNAVRETIEGAIEAGVQFLTLFAFSEENWNRPNREIKALMLLLQRYVEKEQEELKRQGVEVQVHGDMDRVPAGPAAAIRRIQDYTRGGPVLHLNLMISFGGRAELVRAAQSLAAKVQAGELRPEDIDPERFLLWQLAYTELYFSPVLWPDFDRERLYEAIEAYQKRERRFGRVSAS
ncbi:MAG: polyprenyl diphosphate synthase [Gemmatimonadota bacterium]